MKCKFCNPTTKIITCRIAMKNTRGTWILCHLQASSHPNGLLLVYFMLPNQNGDHEVNDKLNNPFGAPWKVKWSPLKPMFLYCCDFCTFKNVFFKQWYLVISRVLGEGTLQFNYRMHVMHFMATLFWFFVIPTGDTIFDLIWLSCYFFLSSLVELVIFLHALESRSCVLLLYTMIHIFVA